MVQILDKIPPECLEVKVPLTNRQLEVARLAGKGWSNRRIGHHLNLTEKTVKVHMEAILKRLNIQRRQQILGSLPELGIEVIPPDFKPHPPTAPLTDREKRVLSLICENKTVKEIARELNLPDSTIRHVREMLYRKTGTGKLAQLIYWARIFTTKVVN